MPGTGSDKMASTSKYLASTPLYKAKAMSETFLDDIKQREPRVYYNKSLYLKVTFLGVRIGPETQNFVPASISYAHIKH